MDPRPTTDTESTRREIGRLVEAHRKASFWFHRTGVASLTAAGLWIVLYCFAADKTDARDALAIMLGGALMWGLFGWSFFLLRKARRIAARVRSLQARLIRKVLEEGTDGRGDG
jgi:hypothetical protein